MSFSIACYTLFDITKTGALNRRRPVDTLNMDINDWVYKRNTQSNYDTIVQAVSLRSQPEIVYEPTKIELTDKECEQFGFVYQFPEKKHAWKFVFEIMHTSVFFDGHDELGYLYTDCDGIPMIKCGTECIDLGNFLDCTEDLRNIYFVKY